MGSAATSLTGCYQDAVAAQTSLDNAVAKLYQQGFTPTPSKTLAEFNAVEADFSGYAAKTITAWEGPVLSGTSGYMILGGQLVWVVETASPVVGNIIAGYYLVSSGGVLRGYVEFNAPVYMQGVGQPCVVDPIQVFPTNIVVTTPG